MHGNENSNHTVSVVTLEYSVNSPNMLISSALTFVLSFLLTERHRHPGLYSWGESVHLQAHGGSNALWEHEIQAKAAWGASRTRWHWRYQMNPQLGLRQKIRQEKIKSSSKLTSPLQLNFWRACTHYTYCTLSSPPFPLSISISPSFLHTPKSENEP